jgi:hypothetical protein
MVKNYKERGFIPILILILLFGLVAVVILFIGNAYKKSEEKKEITTSEVSTPSATPKINTTQKSKSPSIPTPTSVQRKVTPVPTSRPGSNSYPTPTTATYKSPTATPQADDPNDHGRIFIGG